MVILAHVVIQTWVAWGVIVGVHTIVSLGTRKQSQYKISR